MVAAQIGTLGVGERELAAGLLEAMGQDMLVIADRGFFSFEFWRDCLLTGADLLFRVPAGLKLPVLQILPDGSYLSEVALPRPRRPAASRSRWLSAGDPRNATHIPVRVIEYTVTTGRRPRHARDVPADHHHPRPGRRDRDRAGRRVFPALGIRDIAAGDRDPDARTRRRAPVEIPRAASGRNSGACCWPTSPSDP